MSSSITIPRLRVSPFLVLGNVFSNSLQENGLSLLCERKAVVIELQPVHKTTLVLSFNNLNAPIERFKNMNYFI